MALLTAARRGRGGRRGRALRGHPPAVRAGCRSEGRPGASKVLGWPEKLLAPAKLARAFLWGCSDKRQKLAQLLGQLGVLLT